MSFAFPTPQVDQLERQQREMREAEANAERGRAENVRIFTMLFLGLGADTMKLDGTSHDQELLEARGLASSRWHRLLDMEAQVGRDEQALALRPKTRPAELGDDALPDRTIAARGQAYVDETKARIAQLADLRELAKNERKALESQRLDFAKGR
jgi:hypothetical protein